MTMTTTNMSPIRAAGTRVRAVVIAL